MFFVVFNVKFYSEFDIFISDGNFTVAFFLISNVLICVLNLRMSIRKHTVTLLPLKFSV